VGPAVKDRSPDDDKRDARAFEIDLNVAQPARLVNYLAGGSDNFSSDREAAHYMSATVPGGIETVRASVLAIESFLARAVGYLVEAGTRQFVAIGAPIPTSPTADGIHHVAQQAAPESRVVYVGSDPVALAHAHELRASSPMGATSYVHGTLRDPDRMLQNAGVTLDLSRPIAIILPATLSLVRDEHDPHGIVTELLGGVPTGSHLVIAHTASGMPAEGQAEAATRLGESMGKRYVVRGEAEISRFFTGLEMVDPGLVQIDRWRPRDDQPAHDTGGRPIPILAGVGRKP
jgi:hypothetical protein